MRNDLGIDTSIRLYSHYAERKRYSRTFQRDTALHPAGETHMSRKVEERKKKKEVEKSQKK